MVIGAHLRGNRLLDALARYPNERPARSGHRSGAARHVYQSAALRDAEVRRPSRKGLNLLDDGHGITVDGQGREVEADGSQRAGDTVNQVARLRVFGLTCASDERRSPAALQIQYCD